MKKVAMDEEIYSSDCEPSMWGVRSTSAAARITLIPAAEFKIRDPGSYVQERRMRSEAKKIKFTLFHFKY